ncbi:heavy-metal-associated domain-containing protein [Paenibacillus fonticola]|uniref:heavy-metal-associated domain-containing protein n=1 Tax=Paenibacillus fonticola TaxID=379896 RepID=UPI0003643082|nr:heavy-metal-associated domain-containing protein [Paenibacillus fonticola]
MAIKLYQLETVSCPSCIVKIEKMLSKTAGVHSSEVLFNSSRVRVSFDDNEISSEAIKSSIVKLGYKVLGEK